ncbi:hypothetical protein KUW19_00245 [Ferrimonas balearica]|uniref:phage head spike fiber domain-containing protein n=1 Tax=Ferrimonas balearica TaxID=44012 RepID=UPI001C93A3DC|nr:LamG-like jellyroll fold domain-containing protein [Ferrimonas balearica]MBY6104911.1 hypothetical protein [Ferrimonas balearica]
MDLPTINITGKFYAPDGSPLANAPVSVTLTRMSVDPSTGITVPTKRSFVTDANGAVAMDLWPNTMGDAPSFYNISIADTLGRSYPLEPVCVPHQDADGNPIATAKLSDLAATGITWVAGESILLQAQQAVSAAESSAGTAASQAERAKGEADRAKGVADGLLAAGDEQVARVKTEGDGQVARLGSEGDTQVARVIATNNATEVNAGRAEAARTGAEQAEQAAKGHADSAAAVVTGGTGSLTPEPGKLPVADGRGKLDWGWLDLAGVRLGALQNPLLHLFKRNQLVATASEPLLWGRPTHATYVDRYGVLRTAEIDEPRQEKAGWLIEGASTNEFLNSDTLSGVSHASVTDAQEVTPRGFGGPVRRLWVTPSEVDNGQLHQDNGHITVDETATFSIFCRAGSHGSVTLQCWDAGWTPIGNMRVDLFSGEVISTAQLPKAYTVQKLANGWYRLSLTPRPGFAGSQVRTRVTATNGVLNNNTEYLDVWGAQFEKQSFATSYIPTGDAATTRAGESVAGPTFPCVEREGYSVAVKIAPQGGQPSAQVYSTGPGTEDTYLNTGLDGRNNITRGGGYRTETAPSDPPDRHFAVTSDISRRAHYIDGVLHGDGGADAGPTSEVGKVLHFGTSNGQANAYYGHILDFRIYDFALTAPEIALLAEGWK